MESRTQPRSTGLFVGLVVAMLILAMVSRQAWMDPVRGLAKGSLVPLEAGMVGVGAGAGRVAGVFGDIAALRSENQRLAQQNAELRRQLAEASAAEHDNAALRQALDFQRAFGHRTVAAQVVGRGPDGFSRTIEVDRGSADGVKTGMIVTSGAGLVGRVSETGPHAAIIQTLADPQSRVNAYLSKSGLEGTIAGGPDALQMQIGPRLGVTATSGEWAITSGVGGGYPRGLVIGEVARVDHRDSATEDHAFVAWANDPSTLSLLLVITDFVPA